VIFAAFLLPPGLMCLLLILGRYEEWILRRPAPTQPARHARRKRHLSLIPGTGSPAHAAGKSGSGENTTDEPDRRQDGRRRDVDAA
jgi:hypothetical protein